MTKKSLKLVCWGQDEFQKTPEFINKVREIKKEVREKYAASLANTSNVLRKWKIHISILIEIDIRVRQISSAKNLHLSLKAT